MPPQSRGNGTTPGASRRQLSTSSSASSLAPNNNIPNAPIPTIAPTNPSAQHASLNPNSPYSPATSNNSQSPTAPGSTSQPISPSNAYYSSSLGAYIYPTMSPVPPTEPPLQVRAARAALAAMREKERDIPVTGNRESAPSPQNAYYSSALGAFVYPTPGYREPIPAGVKEVSSPPRSSREYPSTLTRDSGAAQSAPVTKTAGPSTPAHVPSHASTLRQPPQRPVFIAGIPSEPASPEEGQDIAKRVFIPVVRIPARGSGPRKKLPRGLYQQNWEIQDPDEIETIATDDTFSFPDSGTETEQSETDDDNEDLSSVISPMHGSTTTSLLGARRSLSRQSFTSSAVYSRPKNTRSTGSLGTFGVHPPIFAPPFYNRPPTPLPPSPSLTSLLRPLPTFSAHPSRPGTPDSSDGDTVATPTGSTATTTAASAVRRSARTATTVPRASPKVPTYEYYGFVLYLGSTVVFLMYILWSYLPTPILHRLGIYYYPDRWWSLAVPGWLVMALCWVYIALTSWNTQWETVRLGALEGFVDEKGQVAVVDEKGKIVRDWGRFELRPGTVTDVTKAVKESGNGTAIGAGVRGVLPKAAGGPRYGRLGIGQTGNSKIRSRSTPADNLPTATSRINGTTNTKRQPHPLHQSQGLSNSDTSPQTHNNSRTNAYQVQSTLNKTTSAPGSRRPSSAHSQASTKSNSVPFPSPLPTPRSTPTPTSTSTPTPTESTPSSPWTSSTSNRASTPTSGSATNSSSSVPGLSFPATSSTSSAAAIPGIASVLATAGGTPQSLQDGSENGDTGQIELDWKKLWSYGTDACMDVPIGGVCEILYGEG